MVLILLGLYIYSLSQLKIVNLELTEIKELSIKGFEFDGVFTIYNGGFWNFGIKRINYVVKIASEQLTEGKLEGTKIEAKKSGKFAFHCRVNWKPSAKLAWSLLTPGNTFARISGSVKLGFWKIPFAKKINIEKYIKKFVKKQVKKFVKENKKTVNEFKQLKDKFFDNLKKMFD